MTAFGAGLECRYINSELLVALENGRPAIIGMAVV
jgi:hypothetical protein